MTVAFPAFAQTAPPSPTPEEDDEVIRIETELIDVPVVVTDRNGRPITGLKEKNFVVYEDGRKQEVANFAATEAPFEVALLLDTSGSTRNEIELIRRAAEQFIASLRKGDRVAIVSFDTAKRSGSADSTSKVFAALTDERETLNAALAVIGGSNGTPLYEGLEQVLDKVFGGKPREEARGRRALVALTDGVDSTSSVEFEDVRRELQAKGIVNYFIRVATQQFFEERVMGHCEDDQSFRFSRTQLDRYYRKFFPRGGVEKVYDFCQIGQFERMEITRRLYQMADADMNELAKVSGGRVFPVAQLREAKTAFGKVAAEIGTKYSLGYYSNNEKRDGGFRKIRVELKGAPVGAQVRAREGYAAPAK